MNVSRYLLREAAVSAVINAAISAGFFFAFFRGMDLIPVWGPGNYAADFVPQSFAVALMSALVPGFLARKGIAEGKFSVVTVPAPTKVALHALAWAVAGLVVGSALAALVLWVSGLEVIPAFPALAIKVAYGAALGALVTHLSVGRLVSQPA